MSLDALRALVEQSYQPDEYPVAYEQAHIWRLTRPLAGLTILDATPVFRNTLTKYIALIEAGAHILIGISEVMPRDEKIVDYLRKHGFDVVTPQTLSHPVDIVLDCAAAFIRCAPRIGYVELTRSGVDKYDSVSKPVFIADSGRIKRIETCLGTGESYYRAMAQIGYKDWANKNLVVFGSGKVGTGLITYAHKMGAHVYVVTRPDDASDLVKSISVKVIDCHDAKQIEEVLVLADAVVSATGVANAMTGNFDPRVLIDSHALIANMGVEDEFGPDIPAERVLENKRTFNFILEEPTLLKYIDATMALHNEGAVWLVENPHAKGLIEPPSHLEARLLETCRRDGTIADELDWIL